MLGIYQKLISSGALARVPELYRQYRKDVETNMPAAKVLQFLPVAAQVARHPSLVHPYTIPEEVTADWFMFNGARVLLPDYEKVKQIVQDALAAK